MALQQHENDQLAGIENPSALVRISTDKTDFSGKKVDFEETLKNHQEKISLFFKEQNWNLEEGENLYKEVLSGGTEYEQRPELMELLKNMKKYDAVVVMEIQRLARQSYVSQLIKKEIEKYQVLIITLNPFKIWDVARNLSDSFQYDIYASMSEYERKVASHRVKANKISMARQGLNSSGSVPFGYVRNPKTKKLEIEMMKDDDGNMVETYKPKVVRQIFQWYLEGEGQRKICDRLNEMGIKNNSGRLWVPNSMRYLLNCQTYIGTLVANNYENVKGKMVATETVVMENNHPAIIDQETWDKTQALRNNKRKRSGVDNREWNNKKHFSSLDGLIYCEGCGRKTNIKWYHNRDAFYLIKCSQYNADGKTCTNGGGSFDELERIVFAKILNYKDEIEEKISQYSDDDFAIRNDELEEQRKVLEKQLKELQMDARAIRNQEKTYEKQKEETGIVDEFEEEMIAEDKLENQTKRLYVADKLAEVKKKISETPSADEEIGKLNKILDIIKELEKRNDDLTVREVNAMLKQIILRINYKRDLPENYKKLSPKTRHLEFPAQIEIEYVE